MILPLTISRLQSNEWQKNTRYFKSSVFVRYEIVELCNYSFYYIHFEINGISSIQIGQK